MGLLENIIRENIENGEQMIKNIITENSKQDNSDYSDELPSHISILSPGLS